MTVTDHVHPIDPVRVAHARRRLPTADDVTRLASLMAIMAEPVRLRLLYDLDLSEELCVGDLTLALGVSEDQATYGLRLLRTAGLVVGRKKGRTVLYRLIMQLDGIVAITMKNEAVGSDAEAEQGRVVSFELLDVAGLGLEKTGEGL